MVVPNRFSGSGGSCIYDLVSARLTWQSVLWQAQKKLLVSQNPLQGYLIHPLTNDPSVWWEARASLVTLAEELRSDWTLSFVLFSKMS